MYSTIYKLKQSCTHDSVLTEVYYGGVSKAVRRKVEQIFDPQTRGILKEYYHRFRLALDREKTP